MKTLTKQGCIEFITELHMELPGKSHQALLEVKIYSVAENCLLPLTAYKRILQATSHQQ